MAAFVIAAQGTSETAIRDDCAVRLSDYKVPDRITLLPGGLPRNANGKLLKTALRAMVHEALLAAGGS